MEWSEKATTTTATAPNRALILVIAPLRLWVWSETHPAFRAFSYKAWRLKFF
jgi:hypothetical protein